MHVGGSHRDSTSPQRSAKRHKVARGIDGQPLPDQAKANDHPRVWPRNMMSIIKCDRSWNLAKTSRKRCYRARTSGTYQTSTGGSHQMTLAPKTTLTTPRQGKMLVETCPVASGCLRSLYTTERPLPECLSKLNWWWKHIGKPDPGSGKGVLIDY